MIKIIKKEECCGCHGCTNVCPKECISMQIDNEGFWYPIVDESKCINCNLCEKVCPIINTPKRDEEKIIAYACKNKDEKVRECSSSGGVFNLLCEEVIYNGGVVFGAAFDDNFDVMHTYAETLDECIKFRGSKYVQSKIGDTFKIAKEFLNEGRIVLFSGTPCQISGLDAYLMKKYDNLILVDIACHGVPSPLVYKEYIKKLQLLNTSGIKDIRFRDKSTGWKTYSFKVEYNNGELKEKGYDNIYMKGFLKDIYLRPSCYTCKFKKPITSADLTLADYWGVQHKHPEFDDDKGISLILVNSKKGQSKFNLISKKIEVVETDLKYATNCNPCIVKHVEYNPKREDFFKAFKGDNITEVIEMYTKISIYQRVKGKIFSIIKNLLVKK